MHRAAQFTLSEPREVKTRKGVTEMRQRKVETRPAGQCYDPLKSGLVLNDRGHWGSPPTDYWQNRNAETNDTEQADAVGSNTEKTGTG